MDFICRQISISVKYFLLQIIEKSRLREENGFVVIGWIPLLAGLCLPSGRPRRR